MNEILDLKQFLLEGNFSEAMKLITELETMARQDKLNAIETFLAILISRLIVIQVIDDIIYRSYVNDIRNSLIEIQRRNRLGDGCYIEADLWRSHYENMVPYAILIAAETTELLESYDVEQLKEAVNFDLLQADTLKLIRTTFSLDVLAIDGYLRYLWPERQVYLY